VTGNSRISFNISSSVERVLWPICAYFSANNQKTHIPFMITYITINFCACVRLCLVVCLFLHSMLDRNHIGISQLAKRIGQTAPLSQEINVKNVQNRQNTIIHIARTILSHSSGGPMDGKSLVAAMETEMPGVAADVGNVGAGAKTHPSVFEVIQGE
jgi:hypothetical protein